MKFRPKMARGTMERYLSVFPKDDCYSALNPLAVAFISILVGALFAFAVGPTTGVVVSVVFAVMSIAYILVKNNPSEAEAWAALNYDEFRDGVRQTYGVDVHPLLFDAIAESIRPYAAVSPSSQRSRAFTIGDKTYTAEFSGDEVVLRSQPSSRTLALSTLGAPEPVDGGEDILAAVSIS